MGAVLVSRVASSERELPLASAGEPGFCSAAASAPSLGNCHWVVAALGRFGESWES